MIKTSTPPTSPNLELVQIPISVVKPSPLNPRKNFDDASFNDLVDSVQMLGVQTPITVRKTEQLIDSVLGKEHGHYFYFHEIVSGERRFRAAVIAGLETIPALIRQGETSDAELVELALIENLQRSNLNAMEEGDGFAKMLELSPNLTQADLAHRLGKSQSYISNAIRLRDLPHEVKELLGRDTLQRAHAVALVAIADLPECVKLAQKAVRENLTQKEVEESVKTIKDAQKAKDQPALIDVLKEEPKAVEGEHIADPAGQAHFDDTEDEFDVADAEGLDAHGEGHPAPVTTTSSAPSVTEKVTTTETTKHETLVVPAAPSAPSVPTIASVKIAGEPKSVPKAASVPVAPSPSSYSAPNNAAPAVPKPKAPVFKTPYGDVDTALCNEVLTSDCLFLLTVLNHDWNKKHEGDAQTTLAERLECILASRAGAAGMDTDELLEIKTKADEEAGL